MGQDDALTIYISAASDLQVERDALARMIAQLPVTVEWRLVQTPVTAEPLDLDALQAADLHILVLGSDIRAPVGLELQYARRSRRSIVAFLKDDITRTPAGQVFINEAGVEWRRFGDVHDLRRQVQQVLGRHLLRHATQYALSPSEVESLEALLADETEEQADAERGGAGESAVILSRERFRPSEGLPLDDPDR